MEETSARKTTAAKKTATKAAGKPAAGGAGSADLEEQAAAPVKKTAARKKATPTAAPADDAHPAAKGGTAPARSVAGRRRLTDASKVLDVLAGSEGPLRAGEVSSRLGLDGQNGAVDAVRTTLERLTKAGRVQRTGRGLYAPAAD
ncbi:type IV toxin-antitoxin system AbiEi family antitoxin domain-containing protein [Kitasatospora sp. NPDC059571]|uniref:type IV toxin-antitoxin system AbiEi family antitoxin domain-containing protein n=1 Tax=Kitasatospora sp. NPDC059571 TaxID=3346871 RepID=UPI00368FAFE8